MEFSSGCLEIFAALVIFILFISLRSEKLGGTYEKHLTSMVVCHVVVLLLDAVHWFLLRRTDIPVILIALSVLPTILALIGNGLFVNFAIAFLSRRGAIPGKAKLIFFLLFIMAILIWTVFILLNGVQSAATLQTNHEAMPYNWVYWVGHLGWSIACVLGIGLILRCRQGLKSNEMLSLLSYCVFPLIALCLRFFWDGSQIFLSTSLSLIYIYSVMQREQRQLLLEQENQLTQSRIAILLSQIQPHFLYNTLTTICGLCDENPKEAKTITAEFADYLRHNLESLSQTAPIPFVEELKHTQVYLGIEQKRFELRLHVVYNIETEDFCIPSLTIQPLVENAVKHGVLKRKKGGTVTITARDADVCFEIIIADDGVGFEQSSSLPATRLHIGTQNVRDRLLSVCGGTLTIDSEVGRGTTAIIKIPKGEIKR